MRRRRGRPWQEGLAARFRGKASRRNAMLRGDSSVVYGIVRATPAKHPALPACHSSPRPTHGFCAQLTSFSHGMRSWPSSGQPASRLLKHPSYSIYPHILRTGTQLANDDLDMHVMPRSGQRGSSLLPPAAAAASFGTRCGELSWAGGARPMDAEDAPQYIVCCAGWWLHPLESDSQPAQHHRSPNKHIANTPTSAGGGCLSVLWSARKLTQNCPCQ